MADSANIVSDVQSGNVINSDTGDVIINSNIIEETIVETDLAESGPQGPAGETGATGAKGDGAAVTIGGNTSGAAALISTGTMYLMGGNNVTLSQNGQSISFIGGAGGGGGGIANQAGTQTATSGTVIFSNSNNVSFGMSQSSIVTASASFSQSVQTQSLMSLNGSSGQLSLTVASSLSMSTNGSTISVGLASNITTALQSAGAYLTTAALSNHSHGNPQLNLTNLSGTTASNSAGLTLSLSAGNYITTARASTDAIGLNTAQTNVTWTVNSSGISLNAGAYLTTAAASNHSHGNPTLALTNLSGTTASNSAGLTLSLSAAAGGGGADGYNILAAGTQTATTAGSVKFADSNGITFGMSGSTQITATVATNYQSQGAYLTTAMQSNAATISNINLSAGTTSLNLSKMTFGDSNGISFGLSGNSVVTATVKTDYQSQGAYLTTAALSNHSHAFSASGGSSVFQTLTFANSNGITFSNSNGSVIASHNGLTTARASTDAIGLNTAQTNVTWTVNSSGISLNAGAYLTTAAASNHSHGNPTLALTNLSGTTASASNGLTLSLSAAAPGGGGALAASASNGSFTFSTLGFSNANNVTFGTSAGSIITASVAAPGAAAENNNHNLLGANTAGNTTASGSTIGMSGINLTLSGTNGSIINFSAPATSSLSGVSPVYFSTNGNTISVGLDEQTGLYFDNMVPQNSLQAITYTTVSTAMFGRVIIQPLTPANELFPFNITADTLRLGFSNSGSSNISQAFTSSWFLGIYTRVNSTQLSLVNSVSTSYGLAANNANSGSFLGARWLSFQSSQWSSAPHFGPVRYFFAFLARTSGAAYASISLAGMHLGQSNQRSGYMATAASSNTSHNAWHPFMGVHSLTTHTAMPTAIANSEINKATAYANFIPQVIFDGGLGAIN